MHKVISIASIIIMVGILVAISDSSDKKPEVNMMFASKGCIEKKEDIKLKSMLIRLDTITNRVALDFNKRVSDSCNLKTYLKVRKRN